MYMLTHKPWGGSILESPQTQPQSFTTSPMASTLKVLQWTSFNVSLTLVRLFSSAEPCSPWLLPVIANGTKTDVQSGNRWRVTYQCNSGYAFYDNPEPGYPQVFTCSGPGNPFNNVGAPYCQGKYNHPTTWVSPTVKVNITIQQCGCPLLPR